MIKIQVILGSIRDNRFGEKPARWIFDVLKKHKDITAEFLDLRDFPLPMFDEPIPPAANNGTYKHKKAKVWADKIDEADGYIIVTPEYNRGTSSALKNAIDYVYHEWNKKPVAFVSYGSIGGARAVEQLRTTAIELQMAPIREAIHIPAFWTFVDEKGNFQAETFQQKGESMINQLLWWTNALKDARMNEVKITT